MQQPAGGGWWRLAWALALAALPWPGGAGDGACDAARRERVRASLGSLERTTCPEAEWLHDFALSDTRRGRREAAVVISIGCNKGFDALSALNLFSQRTWVTGHRWKHFNRFHCGICGQCHAAGHQLIPGVQSRPVQVFCVEPLPATFLRLNTSAVYFDLGARGFHAVHAAFTSEDDARARNWTAAFPAAVAKAPTPAGKASAAKKPSVLRGSEVFGIGVTEGCPRCSFTAVPLMVLDRFVDDRRLGTIDVLTIDTEGNDPNVLLGASRSLGRVRYLEFEYHDLGVWRRTDLRDIIDRLDAHGLVCYWIGKKQAWRLTGCWHDAYGRRQWSNVGCVQRREAEWYGIMERYFNRTVPH